MKKLILLFFSLLAVGGIFQACDNSKTYAEMLDDEKDAVNRFIREHGIKVISKDEFEKDTVTAENEYVAFSNGVYMHIADRGSENPADTFANGNSVIVRYVEQNMMTNDTTAVNVFLPGWEDPRIYSYPAVFRYVSVGTNVYGVFTEMDYLWSYYYSSTAVPAGWLIALPYIRNFAHVKLIVPSKMGHQSAQQSVIPYFYDVWKFQNEPKNIPSDEEDQIK